MFRDPITMLRYEAKRNPMLANMLENISFITEDEIKTTRVMPWIRQALLGMKKAAAEAVTISSLRAWLETQIVDGVMPDPPGETRRWTGDTTFIALKRGHLEIRYGELVWFDKKGGVLIDTIYCERPDPKLFDFTQVIGDMTKLEYFAAVRDRARGEAGPNTPMLQGLSDPAVSSPLTGVQFYRP